MKVKFIIIRKIFTTGNLPYIYPVMVFIHNCKAMVSYLDKKDNHYARFLSTARVLWSSCSTANLSIPETSP
ncbi:hypothetical protein DSUL_140062 [Desulfovibrionales bacterium]